MIDKAKISGKATVYTHFVNPLAKWIVYRFDLKQAAFFD